MMIAWTGPPEDSWLPGVLAEMVVIHAGDSFNEVVDRAEVYPSGILVHISARFKEAKTLEAQRAIGRQVSAFHDGPGHTGPHLYYAFGQAWGGTVLQDQSVQDAEPWAHGSSGGLCRLGFWIPNGPESHGGLNCRMDWPAQGVATNFFYDEGEISRARDQALQLWPGDVPGPHSIRGII